MDKITLEKRVLTGKKAKRLYEQGMVPAVIYNSKTESQNAQIEKGQLEALLQDLTTSTIITVDFEGKESKALVKDLDVNPVNGQYRHVGFFEIDEDQVMTFEIPIKLNGISPAVKNNIGVLVQPLKSVSLRGKYADMVDSIEIDISHLETPGDSIILKDIKLPKGMNVINEEQLEKSVASITQLQKLVETEDEEEGPEAVLDEEGNIVDDEGNILVEADDVTDEMQEAVEAEMESAEGEEGEEGEGGEGAPKAESPAPAEGEDG